MRLLISFSIFGIFIAVTDRGVSKKATRKKITASERRKVLDIRIGDPQLSVKEIAARARIKPATVYKILSLFKDGKIDRDGFQYENPLCL
jgi:hypothetical protein